VSTTVALAAAALFGVGTHLVLQRKLSRIIIGLGLLSHGANVLLMSSGVAGIPPLIGSGDTQEFSDPLPHAFALTTVVITFGVTAFLLALAYRSWLLTSDDEVEDDIADQAVARGGDTDKEVSDDRLAGADLAEFGPSDDDNNLVRRPERDLAP
jgi:multicomponent Na+:H+ antiporter subunit C